MKKLLLLTFFFSLSAFAESRQRIALIDSGLQYQQKYQKYLCKDGHKSFVPGEEWHDDAVGHGTNIVSLVSKDLDYSKYCITILKFYRENLPGLTELEYEIEALKYALTLKVSYVNLSVSGPETNVTEQILFNVLTFQGTKIFVAAGNKNKNLDTHPFYPAAYDIRQNWFVVGNSNAESSNYGRKVNLWEDGNGVGEPRLSGTSQATAIALNKYIRGIK